MFPQHFLWFFWLTSWFSPQCGRLNFFICVYCSSGLSHSEAGKLDNFLHFSKPKNLKKKSILEMGDLNPSIDFLDVLSDDIPKGEAILLGLPYTKTHTTKNHILQDLLQLLWSKLHYQTSQENGHHKIWTHPNSLVEGILTCNASNATWCFSISVCSNRHATLQLMRCDLSTNHYGDSTDWKSRGVSSK